MKRQSYYLNTKLIKQVMKERGVTVKQLADEYDYSERILNDYLEGKRQKNIPLKIGIILRTKLNIKIEDMLTSEPPETV